MTSIPHDGSQSPAREPTLRPVRSHSDILPVYLGSPIETLLMCHGFGQTPRSDGDPTLVVVTCMDSRVILDLPPNFAFQLRTAGANPVPLLTNISVALALRSIRAIAVIGHEDCAMCEIDLAEEPFVSGLVECGWSPEEAREHFKTTVEDYAIDDGVNAALYASSLLRQVYTGVLVAPLWYTVSDGAILQIVAGD